MTFERSHGKARPTLVRASDLQPSESVRDRTDGRRADGRFAEGNRHSIGRGWKTTLKKLLGPKADDEVSRLIRRDAWRVFAATMQVMASDAAPVRAMVSLYAGHVALAAFYRAKATGVGLDTEPGLKLLDVADRQSQRAERTLVTAHDLARLHADQERKNAGPVDPLARWREPAKEPTP
jgi:hypothetical protein